ncbi:hypothetical protein AB3X31_15545 [Raoultella terrigena]|uniref:hypothetical protein n=1 Tax=Raoultella terrigena TaxID=577 RepID=UPI00349F3755
MSVENELVVIVFRGAERLLISVGGVISIWLGYKLFNKALPNNGSFDGGIGSWSIRMQNIAPGVFFALFGAASLIFSILHPFSYENYGDQPAQSDAGNMASNTTQNPGGLKSKLLGVGIGNAPNLHIDDESELLSALFVIDKYGNRISSGLTSDEIDKMNSAIGELHNFQIKLTDKAYGVGSIDKYQVMHSDLQNNKKKINDYSKEDQRLYEGIKKLYEQ